MAVADDPVLPLAARLLGCLCELLPQTVGGQVCVCCLNPGEAAPMDYCCPCEVSGQAAEGQAWVSVVRIYPTSGRFPNQLLEARPRPCAQAAWAADLVMGVYRCAPVPDARGNPPGCDRQWEAAEKLLSDAAAMRQAVQCCFAAGDTDGLVGDVLPGAWTPIGPSGGCMGGAMQVTAAFHDCCPDGS